MREIIQNLRNGASTASLFVPALVCFSFALIVASHPELLTVASILFFAMAGGILFSFARNLAQSRNKFDRLIDNLKKPSQINTQLKQPLMRPNQSLNYRAVRTAGPISVGGVAHSTQITESKELTFSVDDLGEVKKKIVIH